MESLITIEVIPIEFEFVEKKPLNVSAVQASVTQENGSQSIRPQPIRIPIQDTFKPSSDYHWDQVTYTAAANYDDNGKLKLNVQMEDGAARAIRFKQSSQGINSIAARIPEKGSSMALSFNMSRLPGGMPGAKNLNTQFFPPDLELKVTQFPDVIIKYVGGPIYVPPSADPDYVAPLGLEKEKAGAKLNQTI